VQALDDGAWLVQNSQRPLKLEGVDESTWVVQRRRGRRRAVMPIGREKLRTHLLVDMRAAQQYMRGHQMALSHYLAAEHISWLLRELRINCVLDVGANIGQYGQRLRARGYDGRIVSFEPLPHTAERLREAAHGDPDWHVVECALGDAEGTADMNVADGRGATSSLLSPSEFGKSWSSRLEGVRREQVRIRRLEDVFDEAVAGLDSPRVYLKLDTQGYDLQAFSGAGERIRDVLAMQSEVSNVPIYEGMPRLPEQISVYEAAGFQATEMFPVTRDRESLRAIEFDVVMVRPEARS
jgi:FkbM family methyltransferase